MTDLERVARAINTELEGPIADQDFKRQKRQWELSLKLAKIALDALAPERAVVEAIFADGVKRPVTAGVTNDPVTMETAGGIILEFQDRVSHLEEGSTLERVVVEAMKQDLAMLNKRNHELIDEVDRMRAVVEGPPYSIDVADRVLRPLLGSLPATGVALDIFIALHRAALRRARKERK